MKNSILFILFISFSSLSAQGLYNTCWVSGDPVPGQNASLEFAPDSVVKVSLGGFSGPGPTPSYDYIGQYIDYGDTVAIDCSSGQSSWVSFQYTITTSPTTNPILEFSIIQDTCSFLDTYVIPNTWYMCFNSDVEEFNPKSFECYPNPIHDKLIIEIAEKQNEPEFKIFDLLGKEVLNLSLVSGENEVDVSRLKAGIYFISSGTETVKLTKLQQ